MVGIQNYNTSNVSENCIIDYSIINQFDPSAPGCGDISLFMQVMRALATKKQIQQDGKPLKNFIHYLIASLTILFCCNLSMNAITYSHPLHVTNDINVIAEPKFHHLSILIFPNSLPYGQFKLLYRLPLRYRK